MMDCNQYLSQKEKSDIRKMSAKWKETHEEYMESIKQSLDKLEYKLRAKKKTETYITYRIKYATDRASARVDRMCMNILFWPYFSKLIEKIVPRYAEDVLDTFADVKDLMC